MFYQVLREDRILEAHFGEVYVENKKRVPLHQP
jgi:hypothetical protein